ncbi:hypothetical protein HQ531_04445 [bacterium]|nr:hypothetical protein [bacterium]
MKNLYILPLVLILTIWGCSSHNDLEPPDNPLDPGNPDYESPTVEIISGPSEGQVVEATAVTIAWEGNESASEYRYKFDSSVWTEWDEATSQNFDYLDEGNHSFEIQARSINGDEQSTATLLDFEVDAVAGPSVLVYPYQQLGAPGDTLVYQIIAEEVSDLFAAECNVQFDGDFLEIIEILDGDILGEWGGESLVIQEMTAMSLFLSMVAVEGTNISFSGSTSIVTVAVRIRSSASNNSDNVNVIEINGAIFLDSLLEQTPLQTVRSGGLDVQ